ncbi:hypothetical protein N7474_010343 [Penicillium riverlandense]|uniref:uncharacterized protein n=1 Tax=Penicillium riverlandense TaxID=1903569 RepID=UPI0025487793|nr:uncharacterized protein N7474_010343 [Penicillium riverlandense]KAJ5806751.1 hypothetical protein N7474_010343 [Penicillium riverlandense]
MDDYSAHWRDTLMGWDFWKSATVYEEELDHKQEQEQAKNLHTRFPFNLGPEQGLHSAVSADETTKKKHRRGLSVSDLTLTRKGSLRRSASVANAVSSSRLRDFSRLRNSPSKKSATRSVGPGGAKHRPVKPFTLSKPESVFHGPAPESDDIATAADPLSNFKGVETWERLSENKESLELDLFRPVKDDDPLFDITELKPLCLFRRLRSLKLTGMLQSYQTIIWMTAWLNTDLEELELGMAMEPEVVSLSHAGRWTLIRDGWKIDKGLSGAPVYYGQGNGTLHPDIGHGEYLDKQCIETAKVRALAMDHTAKCLQIKTLTLTGFVVDADPFLHWFDPKRLRKICFKGNCVDSGFWLSRGMRKVVVRSTKTIDLDPIPVGIVPLELKKDLKVVDLRGGKKVHEAAFCGINKLLDGSRKET